MKFKIWMKQQSAIGHWTNEGYIDDECDLTPDTEEAALFDPEQLGKLLTMLSCVLEIRIVSDQQCVECGRWMEDEECGDETDEERVCGLCVGASKTS